MLVVLAVVTVVVLSGCSSVLSGDEQLQYTAEPAAVCEGAQSATGYTLDTAEWQNDTREVEVAGETRELRTDSHLNAYLRTAEDGGETTETGGFVVLSTPLAEESGETLNPIGNWSHQQILTEHADQFDQYGTLSDLQRAGTTTLQVLGSEATVTQFNATGQSDDSSTDLRVEVAQVQDGEDYLVLGSVHERGDTTESVRIDGLFGCLEHGSTEGTASSGVTTANRTLAQANASPGESVSATLTVAFEDDHDSVAIQDEWRGPVSSSATIESVSVDRIETDPFFDNPTSDSITVALQNIDAGQTIEITYTLSVDEGTSTGDTVQFTGADESDVVAGAAEADFGTDTVTVVAGEDNTTDGDDGEDSDDENDSDSGDSGPTDDAPATLVDAGTYYVGQTLQRSSDIGADETLDLLNSEGFVGPQFADGDGDLHIDTTGLAAGEYTLQAEDGTELVVFQLIEQEFTTFSVHPWIVTNGGADSETTLTVETNRQPTIHYLTATLEGDQVNASTLNSIFGEGTTVDTETLRVESSNDETFTLDFTGISAGEYELTTTVPDTGVNASTSITVSDH